MSAAIASRCCSVLAPRSSCSTTFARAIAKPSRTACDSFEADITEAERCLAEGHWDGVLHFAALSLVGESMREPMRYFTENAGSGFRLIEACVHCGVKKFVLVLDREPVRPPRRDADHRSRAASTRARPMAKAS